MRPVGGWWSATGSTSSGGDHRGWCGAGRAPRVNDKRVDEVTGQRSRFSLGDPAGVGQEVPQVEQVLPMLYLRTVQRRLRPSAGAVPGHRPRPVVDDDHPVDQGLAGRGEGVQNALLAEVDYVYLWVDGIHLKVVLSRTRCACW